ncbi:MAG: cadmium-translocating P-type ATPase [Thaumarchaeota archaeon]|nr:cadmium-translocating P-type ATPase [Nitrososphaerota archaeon]
MRCEDCDADHDHESLPMKTHSVKKPILLSSIAGVLLLIGLVLKFILDQELFSITLFLASAGIAGHQIVLDGVRSVLHRRLSISFLMTVAAVGAFFVGQGEEGAAVLFLFSIAEVLEERSIEGTKKSLQALVKLAPDTAFVMKGGTEVELKIHDVRVGDKVMVRPGGRIPVDGVVTAGISTVDQSSVTGESMPVTMQAGDLVYAGAINQDGVLKIDVTKSADDTVLSKIVKMVKEAQDEKSVTEKFVERFSSYYTPLVLVGALSIAVVPPLFFGLPLSDWVYRALVLLVISCPCALAISTPVTMLSGITGATRQGVLVKGGIYIEELSKVRAMAFDKTGTLTIGRPIVIDVVPAHNPITVTNLLSIASSLESMSHHPIAKAIVEHTKVEKVKLNEVTNFQEIIGKGVRGTIAGEDYYVGSPVMFRELKMNVNEAHIDALEKAGQTILLVGKEHEVLGTIGIKDQVRDDAKESIRHLKQHGIKTIMLTGDNSTVAKEIAKELGMDEYYSCLHPEDKVRIVDELKQKYGVIAMIGDGINDAPALAHANVGIAMGAIGSDIALETCDVALMMDEPMKLPYLIDLSLKTMSRMKENIIAAILVKGAFALFAIPGLTPLWLAVAVGDMGLTLAVILNAMRVSNLKTDILHHK